jgi:hypothetical protein
VKAGRDRLQIVSHFPGRLRVRAEMFRFLPDVADEVVERLSGEPGVSEARVSRVTGSLLVLYTPRALEVPRLVQIVVRAAGLRGIEVDASEDWTQDAPQGVRVRQRLGAYNEALQSATRGKLDLRTSLPGALVATGAALFVAGRRRVPEWYDLLFWAFVTFSNLNPPARASHGDPSRG